MSHVFGISWTNDNPSDLYCFHVLRMDGLRRSLEIKERYRALSCTKCRNFDLFDALKLGLDPVPELLEMNADHIESEDGVPLFSKRAIRVLLDYGCEMHQFSVPGSPRYLAVYPVHMIEAPPNTPFIPNPTVPWTKPDAFRYTRPPCRSCGRARRITMRMDFLDLPSDLVFTGVRYRNDCGFDSVAMIVNSRVALALRREKFRNLECFPQ